MFYSAQSKLLLKQAFITVLETSLKQYYIVMKRKKMKLINSNTILLIYLPLHINPKNNVGTLFRIENVFSKIFFNQVDRFLSQINYNCCKSANKNDTNKIYGTFTVCTLRLFVQLAYTCPHFCLSLFSIINVSSHAYA